MDDMTVFSDSLFSLQFHFLEYKQQWTTESITTHFTPGPSYSHPFRDSRVNVFDEHKGLRSLECRGQRGCTWFKKHFQLLSTLTIR